MRYLRVALWWAVFACIGGSVVAQGDWPTHGDVLDRGNELSEQELTDLLASSSAVVVLELAGPVFGRVFSCEGDDSLLLSFIPPSTSRAADSDVMPCEVVGSSICFDPRGEWNHCLAVRRLPGSALLYSGFVDEDLPGLRDVPAQVLGILPFEIHRIEEPSGEFDFGPAAITLPRDVVWEFREGRGLPLSLRFGAGPKYEGGIEASISILGWPDPIAGSPGAREPESGEREIA